MATELLIRDIPEMGRGEMEWEYGQLEDAYAEALKDDAGIEVLTAIWRRILELRKALEVAPFA